VIEERSLAHSAAPRPDVEVDRRRFLKRALVTGWSVPIIVTVLARPAHAAHIAPGGACGSGTVNSHCLVPACCCGCTVSGSQPNCCAGGQVCAAGKSGTCCYPTGAKPAVGNCDDASCCSGLCSGGMPATRTCT
jgi:hypothetical protein